MIFIIIGVIGVLLFALFYAVANSSYQQAKQQLIQQLSDNQLSEQEKNNSEKQFSQLLQNKPSSNKMVLLTFAIILLPSSYYFYQSKGTPNITELLQAPNHKQTQIPQMSMEQAMAKLEARLKEKPDDIDAQMLYARSQVSLKNYQAAVGAYRKANQLAPNQSVILIELAEAIAFNNDKRSFLGEPETLIAQAVKLDPKHQKALWLYGMIFYEKGDLAKTNQIWTQLYDVIQGGSAKAQLLEQINDVRSQLGLTTQAPAATTDAIVSQTNEASDALVTASIQVSSELLAKLDNKPAVLYVYTKATTGMPMPIAVFRKSLEQANKSFPIKISISDGNSLQSSRLLSGFQKVKLGARISFSGNATPQTGDFETAEIEIDIPSKKTIELIINSIKQ